MPTLACYLAQVATMALATVFGVLALRAGAAKMAGWLAAVAGAAALAWDCRYTMACQ